MPTRRDFLKSTAIVGGALLGGSTIANAARLLPVTRRSADKLDILVLGGTGFIGPHLVRYAVSRGHRVTIFTRGQHDAELPPEVIRLQGDRNGKLDALVGKRWHAVVDDSATNPDWVRQSAQLLKDSVGHYLFTSSTGVFYPYTKRGLDESTAPAYEASGPPDGSATFGINKAQCERETQRALGDRAIIVRPTFIVGPGDTTDRFPYWPQRLARGGEVLAPGKHDDPVQFIDVRDLAEWMIHLIEDSRGGVYDAAGPQKPMTVSEFLGQARTTLNAEAKFTWVDDYDFLAAHRIQEAIPWALCQGNNYGLMSIKNDRALAAGLTLRPVATTLRDTLAWWNTVPERRAKARFSLSPEREATALTDWHARKS